MRDQALLHPSVQRLKRVAIALGELNNVVVFIGGSIAAILQLDPPFGEARPTKDADGVTASTSYSNLSRLGAALAANGFRASTEHVHRWLSPDGDCFDLMLAGSHLGGSDSRWDALAIETSDAADLSDGVIIRHASAPAFLALKWAAFHDRGATDPLSSHDLEDILALIASRPAIAMEVGAAHGELRSYNVEQCSQLLGRQNIADLLAGHLNNATNAPTAITNVRTQLEAIARFEKSHNRD